jgi:hypothetical protein
VTLFAAALVGAALLVSCNGFTEFGAGKDSSRGNGGNDDEKGDEPAEVAGAFLTCSYLTSDGESATGENSPIGCAVIEDDHKQDPEGRTYALSLTDGTGSDAGLPTLAAELDSEWHMLASFPNALVEDGMLKMTVTGGAEPKTYNLAAKDIGATKLLGNSVGVGDGDELDVKPDESALALTSIAVHAVWKSGGLGLTAGGIAADDFCDSNGPLERFTGLSAAFYSFANGLSGDATGELVTDVITPLAGKTFDVGGEACFRKFSLVLGSGNGEGSSKYAHENSDGNCLFLHGVEAGKQAIYIVDRGQLEGDPDDVTVEALDAFAHAKACE